MGLFDTIVNALGGDDSNLNPQNRLYKGDSAIATFLRGGSIKNGYMKGELVGANKIVAGLEDPTYLAFQFIVDTSEGLFRTTPTSRVMATDGLMRRNDHSYTALEYLNSAVEAAKAHGNADSSKYAPVRGENETEDDYKARLDQWYDNEWGVLKSALEAKSKTDVKGAYNNLKAFTEGFYRICSEYPYYLQAIEGLQDVYKKYYDISKEPFMGGNDTKIKVSCLESMDLRMLALFDAYLRGVYDRRYRRMLVPRNLLKFNCTVIVHDLRRFIGVVTDEGTALDNWEFVEQNTSMIIFEFKNCVFDVEAVGESVAGVSNAEKTLAKSSFQFSYDDVLITVCSLADALEGIEDYDRMRNYKDMTDQSKYARKFGEEINTPEYYSELDFGNAHGDSGGRGLFSTLFNFGQRVFNSATSDSSLGNVYSDGAVGVVSNMLNSIGAGGFGSYLQMQGKEGLKNLGRGALGNIHDDDTRGFVSRMTNGGKFNL